MYGLKLKSDINIYEYNRIEINFQNATLFLVDIEIEKISIN